MNFFNKLLFAIKHPIQAFVHLLGMSVSYSQTGEDRILEIFLGSKKEGFYIDVGANHPKCFNNTYLFYQKGWKGINIEPNQKYIQLFKKIRPKDINLQVAIGDTKDQNDQMTFYVMDVDTLSTCDYDTALRYEQMGHKIIAKYFVPVMKISDVIETYATGKEIDILLVDVEGYDLKVLQTNDWKKYRPTYVVVETLEYKNDGTGQKLSQVFDNFFTSIQYRKIADTYVNSIYLRK